MHWPYLVCSWVLCEFVYVGEGWLLVGYTRVGVWCLMRWVLRVGKAGKGDLGCW